MRLFVKKYPYRGQQSFVNNQKHVSGKERLRQKVKLERDLKEVLYTYDDRNDPKGGTLSMESRVFRVKIVTAFLKGGVAINKINFLLKYPTRVILQTYKWKSRFRALILFGGKRRKLNRKNSMEEIFPLPLIAQQGKERN